MSASEVSAIREEINALARNIAVLTEKFDALDGKVDKHNGLVERMYVVEGKLDNLKCSHDDIQAQKRAQTAPWYSLLPSILSALTTAGILALLALGK